MLCWGALWMYQMAEEENPVIFRCLCFANQFLNRCSVVVRHIMLVGWTLLQWMAKDAVTIVQDWLNFLDDLIQRALQRPDKDQTALAESRKRERKGRERTFRKCVLLSPVCASEHLQNQTQCQPLRLFLLHLNKETIGSCVGTDEHGQPCDLTMVHSGAAFHPLLPQVFVLV